MPAGYTPRHVGLNLVLLPVSEISIDVILEAWEIKKFM